jgi:hypothetical protein
VFADAVRRIRHDLARPSSKAEAEGQTLVFIDEAGFYPYPL